jgi:hypothetical protein
LYEHWKREVFNFFAAIDLVLISEMIREQKRMVDRSVRELAREQTKMERTEQQLINDIRKAAKAGQTVCSHQHRFWNVTQSGGVSHVCSFPVITSIRFRFRSLPRSWQKIWSAHANTRQSSSTSWHNFV